MITQPTAADLVEALREIVRAGRAVRTHHPEDGPGLPSSAAAILALLDTADGLRFGCVAERLGMDPSVVSRQVAALTASGLVERRPDPLDGRAHHLHMTDAGRRVLADYRADRAAQVQRVLTDWSDTEARVLVEALTRLRTDFHRVSHTLS